jgi:hypothetical protein
MLQQLAEYARPVLDFPYIRKTRRNHGLEHATVHVLTSHYKGVRVAGRSTDRGFVIIGNVSTEAIEQAAHEALDRMRRGEHHLAVHPNCGTNLVTASALTTLTGVIGLSGGSKRFDMNRISWTMTMMVFALIFAQPLGMKLQRHFTTEGDPGDLEIVRVTRRRSWWPFANLPVHYVETRRG